MEDIQLDRFINELRRPNSRRCVALHMINSLSFSKTERSHPILVCTSFFHPATSNRIILFSLSHYFHHHSFVIRVFVFITATSKTVPISLPCKNCQIPLCELVLP